MTTTSCDYNRNPNCEPNGIAFCSSLYKLQYLFPQSPEDDNAYGFYIALVALSLLPVFFIVFRLRRQHQLLKNGHITEMKQWLLPVYETFLWFVIIIYFCKAIEITVVYLIVKIKMCQVYLPVAFVHAATFWTSEFWLMNGLLIFLASNSHGIATIRRAFFISTVLWFVDAICITIGINGCSHKYYSYYIMVYIFELLLIIGIMVHMKIKSYPHHKYLWLIVIVFFVTVSCRFASYFLRYKKYDGFCFMDIADYISSMTIPALIINTLRRDSHHWSSIMLGMTEANRTSIVDVIASQVGGHDRESMTCWSELLSQHAKLLKAESLLLIDSENRNIGASGAVTKARYKGKMVAIKECKFERFTKHIIAAWCKEALISSNFQHRNIVRLIGICIEPPSIKIVMQYCRHGSLRKLLISQQPLSWRIRFQFLLDIAEGMNHLHSNNLVHRDLKTLNLLVDEDAYGSYVIKICDFGSSRSVDVDVYYESMLSSVASVRSIDTMNTGFSTTAAAAAAMTAPNQYHNNDRHFNYYNNNTNTNFAYPKLTNASHLSHASHGSYISSASEITSPNYHHNSSNNRILMSPQKLHRINTSNNKNKKVKYTKYSEDSKSNNNSNNNNMYTENDNYYGNIDINISPQDVATAMSTIVGSVQFLAPEILSNIEFKQGSRNAKSKQSSVYGFSADVYSFGCVIWEIITRKELFKGMAYIDIQNFILSNKRPNIKEPYFKGCPDSTFLIDLMNACWQQDPTKRPSFAQIIIMLEEKRDVFIPSASLRS